MPRAAVWRGRSRRSPRGPARRPCRPRRCSRPNRPRHRAWCRPGSAAGCASSGCPRRAGPSAWSACRPAWCRRAGSRSAAPRRGWRRRACRRPRPCPRANAGRRAARSWSRQLPSPSASRSSTSLFGDGASAPALRNRNPATRLVSPPPATIRSGALVSATSTSPLGSVYIDPRMIEALGEAVHRQPGGGLGRFAVAPADRVDTSTVGIVCGSGSASVGSVPVTLSIAVRRDRRAAPTRRQRPRTRIRPPGRCRFS